MKFENIENVDVSYNDDDKKRRYYGYAIRLGKKKRRK